jgi:UDP-N-acetylglucosamine acyltransferase
MGRIHPSAVIDRSAELAEDVVVGPNCVIEPAASIGPRTVLDANVLIGRNVRLGKNNRLYPNCVIGRMPQILGLKEDAPMGGLVFGDNNIIREQVTIHPSIHPDRATVIGSDNLIMVGVHIGHDCIIEDRTVLSNYTQISGHCHIQTGVWLSGMVGVHQFVTIGRWSYAAGMTGINHDVPPFVIVSGHYPPRIRAVNKRRLKTAGLTEQQQANISEAFRKLYRQGGALLENAKALAAQDGLDPNVRDMVELIINSSQHRYGRYREQFRHE